MIGDLTVRRMQALSRHWEQYPPVHMAVALALGAGRGAPAPTATGGSNDALADWLNGMPTRA